MKQLRRRMTTAAVALLIAAAHIALLGLEDRIVHGATLGTDTASLLASTPACYCSEDC